VRLFGAELKRARAPRVKLGPEDGVTMAEFSREQSGRG